MMRFITEREVDLRQPKSKRNHLSRFNLPLEDSAQCPQDPQSFSQAVSSFKKNDEHSDQLLKRLIVLKQQQRKLQGRTIQNTSKLSHYKSIRDEIQLHHKQSQQHRQQLAKEMQMTRSIIRQEREAQAYKFQQTKRKMYFDRWFNYLDQRENYRTEMNATRLQFNTQLLKKQQKSSEIRLMEEIQKQNISQFHQKKKNKIRLESLKQKMKLSSMTEQKQDEVQTLSHMESILISRQARSRMNSEESISLLKNIVTYKNDSKSLKHSKNSITSNDIYII